MATFLTVADAAQTLGLSEYAVRSAYRTGTLPHRLVGRLVKFTQDDLDEYVAKTKVAPVLAPAQRRGRARRSA